MLCLRAFLRRNRVRITAPRRGRDRKVAIDPHAPTPAAPERLLTATTWTRAPIMMIRCADNTQSAGRSNRRRSWCLYTHYDLLPTICAPAQLLVPHLLNPRSPRSDVVYLPSLTHTRATTTPLTTHACHDHTPTAPPSRARHVHVEFTPKPAETATVPPPSVRLHTSPASPRHAPPRHARGRFNRYISVFYI